VQVSFLSAEGRSSKVIVYFLTCASVEFYSLVMQRLPLLKGLQVSSLHGKLKQVGAKVLGRSRGAHESCSG
jgi:ATP-dependent RNA helicase DDX55/SPB4